MKIKLFEIRDRGTFIPVMAVKLSPSNASERYLLSRSGYGRTINEQERYVCMWALTGGEMTYDQHSWGNRTRQVAHDYIITNFDALEEGQVVDVEYLLGETQEPKISEMYA